MGGGRGGRKINEVRDEVERRSGGFVVQRTEWQKKEGKRNELTKKKKVTKKKGDKSKPQSHTCKLI
jgi:hypothetical protein